VERVSAGGRDKREELRPGVSRVDAHVDEVGAEPEERHRDGEVVLLAVEGESRHNRGHQLQDGSAGNLQELAEVREGQVARFVDDQVDSVEDAGVHRVLQVTEEDVGEEEEHRGAVPPHSPPAPGAHPFHQGRVGRGVDPVGL